MPIRITSKRDGFWRAGVRHTSEPATYPDGRFTKKELKALEDEPMLVVERVESPKEKGEGSGKGKGGKGTKDKESAKDENDKDEGGGKGS